MYVHRNLRDWRIAALHKLSQDLIVAEVKFVQQLTYPQKQFQGDASPQEAEDTRAWSCPALALYCLTQHRRLDRPASFPRAPSCPGFVRVGLALEIK